MIYLNIHFVLTSLYYKIFNFFEYDEIYEKIYYNYNPLYGFFHFLNKNIIIINSINDNNGINN